MTALTGTKHHIIYDAERTEETRAKAPRLASGETGRFCGKEVTRLYLTNGQVEYTFTCQWNNNRNTFVYHFEYAEDEYSMIKMKNISSSNHQVFVAHRRSDFSRFVVKTYTEAGSKYQRMIHHNDVEGFEKVDAFAKNNPHLRLRIAEQYAKPEDTAFAMMEYVDNNEIKPWVKGQKLLDLSAEGWRRLMELTSIFQQSWTDKEDLCNFTAENVHYSKGNWVVVSARSYPLLGNKEKAMSLSSYIKSHAAGNKEVHKFLTHSVFATKNYDPQLSYLDTPSAPSLIAIPDYYEI